MRILIAEDELPLAKALLRILEKSNYSADAVFNGEDALQYLEAGNYDALILDLMMPKIDGITVLQTLRARGITIPVLILTAKSEIDDKVLGLDSGANYYLTKPFDMKELLAALRVITRGSRDTDSTLSFGNVTLDRATFTLSSAAGRFRLANKEFQLMEFFLSNPTRVLSTERLLEKIWGYDSDTEINVVWVYISYLRKKLSALGGNIEIRSHRNAGYSLERRDTP